MIDGRAALAAIMGRSPRLSILAMGPFMPFSLFKRKLPTDEANRAYETIVAQARLPFFYLECGVPDTLDGRFDLIVLHAFLAMHRTAGKGEAAEQFNQSLFDTMFRRHGR